MDERSRSTDWASGVGGVMALAPATLAGQDAHLLPPDVCARRRSTGEVASRSVTPPGRRSLPTIPESPERERRDSACCEFFQLDDGDTDGESEAEAPAQVDQDDGRGELLVLAGEAGRSEDTSSWFEDSGARGEPQDGFDGGDHGGVVASWFEEHHEQQHQQPEDLPELPGSGRLLRQSYYGAAGLQLVPFVASPVGSASLPASGPQWQQRDGSEERDEEEEEEEAGSDGECEDFFFSAWPRSCSMYGSRGGAAAAPVGGLQALGSGSTFYDWTRRSSDADGPPQARGAAAQPACAGAVATQCFQEPDRRPRQPCEQQLAALEAERGPAAPAAAKVSYYG